MFQLIVLLGKIRQKLLNKNNFYDIIFFNLASSGFGSVFLESKMGSSFLFDIFGLRAIYEDTVWWYRIREKLI